MEPTGTPTLPSSAAIQYFFFLEALKVVNLAGHLLSYHGNAHKLLTDGATGSASGCCGVLFVLLIEHRSSFPIHHRC